MDGDMMKLPQGFTLFDLMVSIAIIGILVGLGAPSVEHMAAKSSADANAHTIWQTLAKTRETAVISGKETTFCGIDHNNRCVRDDIGALIIFHDDDRDGQLSANERAIYHVDLHYSGTVRLRASNRRYILYTHDGYANPYGSIITCPSNGNPRYIRRISTNPSGRHYQARDRNGDGIIAGAGDEPIEC